MGFDMSFQAMAWALKQPAKTNEKFLLIVIANYADERGHAWPSVERLAVDTGMSRATIKRCLKKLEDGKFLSRHKRVKGRLQTSNLYALNGRFS
jgi:DNA-binding MarR family transcriptional regulator